MAVVVVINSGGGGGSNSSSSSNHRMHGIYNYIPETNHVSRLYNVAAILWLQFMAHVIILPTLNVVYFYISTFRSVCAVPSMAVVCIPLRPASQECCSGIF